MKKTVKYKAQGLVFGNYWSGGSGRYAARKLQADTKEDLINQINNGIANGSLDSGVGYKSLKGAVMDITTITTIIVDGQRVTNRETVTEFFGKMEKKLIKLKAKIQGITANMEYRSKKLFGVLCSRADLEITEMYIDVYLRQGNINGFMNPMGNVKKVFDKANIQFN